MWCSPVCWRDGTGASDSRWWGCWIRQGWLRGALRWTGAGRNLHRFYKSDRRSSLGARDDDVMCWAKSAPHPAFGHLLPVRGTERRRADVFPSPRLRGEGGAQRRMRGRAVVMLAKEHPSSGLRPPSPRAVHGEKESTAVFLLPALGTGRRKAARRMCFSFSPPAGRRWREATVEGRPTEHGLTMSACSPTPRPLPINC